MSNVRATKKGLIEKSTGRKIKSPLDMKIYPEITKSEIDDMTSLNASGVNILDMHLGCLLSLLSTKGPQYDWLMDVLEHPKKRAQTLREWKQYNKPRRLVIACGNPKKSSCLLLQKP